MNNKQKKEPIRHTTLVNTIIYRLMCDIGIRESELARQTGLPQTTINRLLTGLTSDPRANTLKPIANYFGVTIGQLIGDEPLHLERTPGTLSTKNREAQSHVPLISWKEVMNWVNMNSSYTIHSHEKHIVTESPISKASFAIYSKQFMEPKFKNNSILIVDPKVEYSDEKFIVVSLDNTTVTIRQIFFDNSAFYLKNFDATIPTIKLEDDKHHILGVVVEARMRF